MKKNRRQEPRKDGSFFEKILSPGIWRKITSVSLAVVVFLTTYMMILPALTIDLDTAVEEPGMEVAMAGSDLDKLVSDDANEAVPGVGESQAGIIDELSEDAEVFSEGIGDFAEKTEAVSIEDEKTETEFAEAGDGENSEPDISGDDSIQGTFDDSLLPLEESGDGVTEGSVENPEGSGEGVSEDSAENPEGFGEGMSEGSVEVPEEFGEELTEGSVGNPEEPGEELTEGSVENSEMATENLPADEQEAIDEVTESAELIIDGAEAPEDAAEETEVEESATEVSVPSHVLKAEGDDYRVTVTYTDDAEIPEGAELLVTEVLSDDSDYEHYVSEASEVLSTEKRIMSVNEARFFDITIIDGNKSVEPKAPVTVLVELADSFAAEEAATVIHYTDEDETEVVDTVDPEEAAASIEEAEAADALAVETAAEAAAVETDSEGTLSPELSAEMINDSVDTEPAYRTGLEEFCEQNAEEVPLAGTESEEVVENEPAEEGEDDLAEDAETEPAEDVGVEFTKDVEAELPEEAEELGFDELMNPIAFVTDSFSVYGFVTATLEKTILASDGHNYKVSITCGPDAGIPEDAELSVEEITQDVVDYDAYVANVENILGKGEKSVEYVRLFDIKIVDALDPTVKYQPAEGSGVNVRIDLADTESKDLSVVHFEEDEETEIEGKLLDAKTENGIEDTSVEFETAGFSVFAVAYTVDFSYAFNGKTYAFSLPGGGFVSLEHLIEALGISEIDAHSSYTNVSENESADDNAERIPENGTERIQNNTDNNIENGTETDDELVEIKSEENVNRENNKLFEETIKLNESEVSGATKKLVSNVESVEFSSPELVWVGKIDEATTVGELKEIRALESENSADLTEEQIAEINAQTVEAGDWALISLHPFTSEENLTVTMKNGEQFVVRVTDEQISTHVITADGEDYIITVTYGPEAGIPDGAELTARELLQGTEEYEAYYAQAVAGLRADIDLNESFDPENDDEYVHGLKEYGLEVVNLNAENEIQFSRFFDITILADGEEVEPEAPVMVSIRYYKPIEAGLDAEANIVHFAADGVEVIKPDTITDENDREAISTFVFEQSSFSITATMLNYTKNVTEGKYVIIKGTTDSYDNAHYYAMKANGTPVEIAKDGNALSNIPDECSWTFTRQSDGNYIIENDSYDSWLTLYNTVTGNWNQHIKIEQMNGNKGVAFRNPGTNQALRWNGNNNSYYISSNGNAETFFIARVNSDINKGRGYNLKPTGETELGDLLNIQDKINDSKIIVDKSASVYDYDNRIYRIDLKALSDVTILLNKIDLELIVDTSRSMYFPANLYPVNNAVFNKIEGTDQYSLTEVVKNLDTSKVYYFIGEGEKATVFALYYAASGTNLNDHSGAQQWRYVDASYMNPPDAASMNQSDVINRLSGRNIEDFNLSFNLNDWNGTVSRVYTSPDGYTRLSYLKEAVRIASEIVYALDKNNRIGLVTFNSKVNNPRFYDNASKTGLYSAITNISLAGGTRQDLGLEAGANLFNNSGRVDAEKIAILITDGAPNMQDANNQQIASDTAWSMIGEKAGALKGENSSNAKLYTLGLSLDMVGGNNQRHLDGLASEEDGVTRHFNASNGPAIASAIKNLIDTLVYDVTLEAEVADVLDPAFYPVDQNGNPIPAGDYTDENGKRYNWSVTTVDGVECWKITYYDQEVGRGEKNADNTIKTPGWQKSFYVKAKEDFLGGNDIETNRYKSSNNRVKPTKYVYTERGTNAIKKVDPPSNAPWGKFENTPTVNVDELHVTNHSTEWTVYLGTEVKPEDQVKALWDEIRVKQVVKTDGTVNNGTTITNGDKRWYSKTDTVDTAAPDENYSSLPINRFFSEVDFNTLLNLLKTQNSAEKTINYTAYGHQPGTITVKLEKEIINGTVDANGKAPGRHITDKEGTPAEKYTITVNYVPDKTDTNCNIGHVTTGTGADEVKSTNEHKINVIKKGLQIEKRDKDSNDLISNSATFKLYRPAVISAGETGIALDGLSGSFYEVATLTTSEGISTLDSQLPELRKLPDGQHYYLVETSEPKGYIKPTAPVQVDVSVTDGMQTKPYEATEGITTLINKEAPTANVIITSDYAEAGETADNVFVIKINNEAKSVDIMIHKVDDKNTGLSGATFKLMNGPEVVPVSSSGTGVVVEPKVSGQNVTIKDNTFTIPSGGVTIKNLKVSDEEYDIVEVSPPSGYIIINSTPAKFKVTAGQITDEEHIVGVTYTSATNDFIIPNTPGAVLPNTGGPGTRSYMLLGSILILGSGVLLWRRRRLI